MRPCIPTLHIKHVSHAAFLGILPVLGASSSPSQTKQSPQPRIEGQAQGRHQPMAVRLHAKEFPRALRPPPVFAQEAHYGTNSSTPQRQAEM
jgi:hypothetical protein